MAMQNIQSNCIKSASNQQFMIEKKKKQLDALRLVFYKINFFFIKCEKKRLYKIKRNVQKYLNDSECGEEFHVAP